MATALAATGQAPLTRTFYHRAAVVAAGADTEENAFTMPFSGTVALSIVPDTVLTGADTESRTISARNLGAAGAGTVVMASKAFTAGVNAAVDDETVITASAVAGAIDAVEGDVISYKSLHVGGTGLAQPALLAKFVATRA